MLNMHKVQQMTDEVHGTIIYSGIEDAVISTPVFNRLHKVLQSSLVYLTYPSNKVKRFEHSIGTMYLAGEILYHSFCNSSEKNCEELISQIKKEVAVWRQNVDLTKYSFMPRELKVKYQEQEIFNAPIPESGFYNLYYPGNLKVQDKFVFFVLFQAVRLAGLLHDAGHMPYSHILEYALKRMYGVVRDKEVKTTVENEYLQLFSSYAEGKEEIHEEIGKRLVDIIRDCITENLPKRADDSLFFFLISFDFASKIVCSAPSDDNLFARLHFLTASVLDADRMDYCSRDLYCSGMNKNVFEYKRLLETYKLCFVNEENKEKLFFCPASKTLPVVEDLLQRRHRIFQDINYHHRVHKHEILLEEVLCDLGLEELGNMSTIQALPNALPLQVSSIWKMVSKLHDTNSWIEYQIIQLDDSWLDTLLKTSFFNKYQDEYLSLSKYGNDTMWNRFDELISANKHYVSFFKRAVDFRNFDKQFFNLSKTQIEQIKSNENNLNIMDDLSEIFSGDYKEFIEKNQYFFLNFCIDKLYDLDVKRKLLFDCIEKDLNKADVRETHIIDCIIRSCMFNFGYNLAKTPVYLLDPNDEPIRLDQLSTQLKSFQMKRALSPLFHLYYLPEYDCTNGTNYTIDVNIYSQVLLTAVMSNIWKI